MGRKMSSTNSALRSGSRSANRAGKRSGTSPSSIFFFQAEDGIRDLTVTGVQTCALPIWRQLLSFADLDSAEPVLRLAGRDRRLRPKLDYQRLSGEARIALNAQRAPRGLGAGLAVAPRPRRRGPFGGLRDARRSLQKPFLGQPSLPDRRHDRGLDRFDLLGRQVGA